MVDKSNVAICSAMFDNTNMAEAEENATYRALMALKPDDITTNKWAKDAGLARNVFQNIRDHGNPKFETLTSLLKVIGKSLSDLEMQMGSVSSEVALAAPRSTEDVRSMFFAGRDVPALKVYGTASGGEYENVDEMVETVELWYSQVIEYVARPAELEADKQAYALTIVGDSMLPRFKPRERVAVSPRAPVAIGDDVIVQLRGPDGDGGERIKLVLIKELVRRTASHVELRQFNPDMTFRVDARRVAAIHKVTSNLY